MKRHGKGEELFERCDTREISGRSVLLEMGNPCISDSVDNLQMLFQDRLLLSEHLLDVFRPVGRRLDTVLVRERSGSA